MLKIPHRTLPRVLILGVVLATACTQTYSQAPLATPTLISTGLFVSPFPSGQDPLQIVADLGTQTAVAKTAAAGGATTPGTAVSITGTPPTAAAASVTPTLGTAITSAVTSGPTTSSASTVVPATKSATPQVSFGATSVVSVPSTYTLQQGEFPYCIARRFNINPEQLLTANGITDGSILYPGKVLTIPQGAGAFPGDRSLRDHPASYTVPSADMTIYGVACIFGDALPQDIASANGLSLTSSLTAGQQLSIP